MEIFKGGIDNIALKMTLGPAINEKGATIKKEEATAIGMMPQTHIVMKSVSGEGSLIECVLRCCTRKWYLSVALNCLYISVDLLYIIFPRSFPKKNARRL
jgi:hypothetical protein